MKKLSQFSSIIISYIANVILLLGDYFFLMFWVRSNDKVDNEAALGHGLGLAFIVMIGVIILIVGLIVKAISLPVTIKFFIDSIRKKIDHSKRWMIAHIVDYAIFLVLIIFVLVVLIVK